MMPNRLAHQFVTSFPAVLEAGVLYVSIEYDTSSHLCACGCLNQVVLPLHPTAWRVTYDGETVSMSPSVGNWSFQCRSHYWIERGRIRWAPTWTDAQVAAGRSRTLLERAGDQLVNDSDAPVHRRLPWWRRVAKALLRSQVD